MTENDLIAIAIKFASSYPIGYTILIPNSNNLSRYVAEIMISKGENVKLIEGSVRKQPSSIIDGQDIIVIDDTISKGQTIEEVCSAIIDSYTPKSITVLTLNLHKESGLKVTDRIAVKITPNETIAKTLDSYSEYIMTQVNADCILLEDNDGIETDIDGLKVNIKVEKL